MDYRKFELTKQVLNMVGRVIQRLIRQQDARNEMQFCSMSGSGITNVMKCLVKKDLYFSFVDKETQTLCLCVYSLQNACSRVRLKGSFKDHFLIHLRLHQGSVIIPLFYL